MECTHDVTDFGSTKRALASLQRLLFCCQCSQLTKNVCTLGNCGHFFCKQCIEEQLGAQCPVCSTPAHARDAQVNRQLSNIVSLSLELGRLLKTEPQADDEGGAEKEKPSTKPACPVVANSSSVHKASSANLKNTEDAIHRKNLKSPSQMVATTGNTPLTLGLKHNVTSSALGSSGENKENGACQKISQSKDAAEICEATLMQLCEEVDCSDDTGEACGRSASTDKRNDSVAKTMTPPPPPPPQTRVRSKRRQSGVSDTRKEMLEKADDLNLGVSHIHAPEETVTHEGNISHGENLAAASAQHPAAETPRRRGRPRKTEESAELGSEEKGRVNPSTPSNQNGISSCRSRKSSSFPARGSGNTSTSSPRNSPRGCSGSAPNQVPQGPPGNSPRGCSVSTPNQMPQGSTQSNEKRRSVSCRLRETNPQFVCESAPTRSSTATPRRTSRGAVQSDSKRRRSAPETPKQTRPHCDQHTPQRGRKSLPVLLSPAERSRRSLSSHTGSADQSGNKTRTGASGSPLVRVKRNAKGETPLHVAAIKGDLSAVKELLDKGDNPNVRDNAGWTPLHEAVNHGNTAVAEVLLRNGAMVNTPGMENDTPLHDAVANNKLECVRLLIAYGASDAARNVHGRTALELAKTVEMKDALKQPALQPQHANHLPEPEDSEEFLPLCFLGTALSRDQRGSLQKCATMLHAKVADNYSAEVTHIVSSVNADGQCPRTMKYLQAVLGGKWIVSFDWVTICLEYGNKVSEEPFEIPGSSTHPNSSAAHKARINRKLQLPPLFDGCQVYLQGSFTRTPPSKHELTDLLRLGGAHLLTREPRLSSLDEYEVTVPYHASQNSTLVDCGIFIVHDEAGVHSLQACRMRTVPASWVIECIAKFSLVEPPSD